MRAGIAVLTGTIAGIAAISLLELTFPLLFHSSLNNGSDIPEILSMVWLTLIWLTGGFFAGLFTSLIDQRRSLSLITASLLAISAIINFVILPHPWWFMITTIALFIPVVLASNFLVKKFQKKSSSL